METQKLWAQIIGVILLLVGILGFFMEPSIFNIFGVNIWHNLVHLITGAIFAWVGFSRDAPTKMVNQWLGVVYILVGIIGWFGLLTFLNVGAGTDPDNFLHLGIGIVSALIGWFAN